VQDNATPMHTPALQTKAAGLLAQVIPASPSAYKTRPTAITRAAPKRSATMPVNGCATPQARFWMASANAKVSRVQPRSATMGSWNSPCT